MATNKLLLNSLMEEEYKLIAIHCSAEAYKLAFLINKYLDTRLQRETIDVDFSYKEGMAFYELYKFYNKTLGCDYYLVSNKYKIKPNHLQSNGFLFDEETSFTANLVPEYKNVDYFLKIEDNAESVSTKKVLIELNNINQVVTAYEIEVASLKSNQNLIFR